MVAKDPGSEVDEKDKSKSKRPLEGDCETTIVEEPALAEIVSAVVQ